MNALRHGLRAQQVLLSSEDASEFQAFQEGMKVDLKPAGELEGFLFGQVVAYAWRLRRCQGIEGSLLSLGMGHEKVDRAYEKVRSCFEGYTPVQLPNASLVKGSTFDEAVLEETEGRSQRDSQGTILGAASCMLVQSVA